VSRRPDSHLRDPAGAGLGQFQRPAAAYGIAVVINSVTIMLLAG